MKKSRTEQIKINGIIQIARCKIFKEPKVQMLVLTYELI